MSANPDILCPKTGEVCGLKVALSELEYQEGAPEDAQDFTQLAKESGFYKTLGFRDLMKLATLTGHVTGPGVSVEEKDDYVYALNDAECPGSKRSLGILGKRVCRAPVEIWHVTPNQ